MTTIIFKRSIKKVLVFTFPKSFFLNNLRTVTMTKQKLMIKPATTKSTSPQQKQQQQQQQQQLQSISSPSLSEKLAREKLARIKVPTKYYEYKLDRNWKLNYFNNKQIIKEPETAIQKGTVKSNFEDYYKILGIRDNSTIEDIKRAYYILAKKYHPDCLVGYNKQTGDEFKKIVEAYNVLSDSTKKSRYDQLRLKSSTDCIKILSSTSFRFKDQTDKLKRLLNKDLNPTNDDPTIPNELMTKYRHNIIEVPVSFLESVQGTTKDITVKTFTNCPKCNQSKDRRSLVICKKCNGMGSYIVQTKTYKCHKECDMCYGCCYTAMCKCLRCSNRGFLLKDTKLNVSIKRGVQNNEIIKIPHPDDSKLNLQVKVKVNETDQFKRKDNDIFSERKLTISEAVLGGTFQVKGIYGDINVDLSAGLGESQVKLAGKGIKTQNNGTGDHYVQFKINIPKHLTKEQRSLFMELSKLEKSPMYNKIKI